MARLALSAEQKQSLADALQKGELGLIAQVYDSTYRSPGLRDAVVQHAARLAPSSLRNVTTAADLGVMTSGQPMMLAPRSEQMLASRAKGAGIGASAYDVAAAVNPTPNVPAPPSADSQTWHLTMIGAQIANGPGRGFTGAGVNVTVADTGFDTTNAGLGNKLLTDLGRNYVLPSAGATYNDRQLDPLPGQVTDVHGSHVAGIIAGQLLDPATGIVARGVAYDAMIIPLRSLLATKSTAAGAPGIPDGTVAAMNYFAGLTNSMVYNASYAQAPGDDDPPQKVWTIYNVSNKAAAIEKALEKGKIIVAANGNARQHSPDAGQNPSSMALYPFFNPHNQQNSSVYNDQGQGIDLTYFNSMAGKIIGVMSVGDNKQAAGYSQLCGVTASWCVAAPGGNTDYINGRGVYATVPDNTYGAIEGTSMAAPVVSGAIAVLIQANPTYNAQDLSRLLFSTTEDLGKPGVDAVYGYGLIRLDRATDGPTTLAAGTVKSVAADTTEYWSRLLSTQGSFTKDGEGILTIAGRTNANGNVFAQLGTLAVDGTLSMPAGNRLTVAPAATLAGIGTVAGDTVIAGTLSPGKMANIADLRNNGVAPSAPLQGNSVGMLTFNGNVTLTATANTRIDIDGTLLIPGGPGTFDRIYVTGAGNVFYAAGTLTPVLRGSVGTVSNYTPAIGTTFAFVETDNGARTAGSFDSIKQPTEGMPANTRFDLIYQPTSITLRVTPASFGALAANDNLDASQRGIAAILDKERAASGVMPTAAEKALFDALYKLNTEAEFDKALEQLGGPGQPAIAAASLQAFSGFLGAVGDRQDALAFGSEQGQNGTAQSFALSYAGRNMMTAETSSAMNAFASITPAQRVQDGWTVWGQGFGRTSRIGDSGDLSGSKTTSAGFTLGADRWFSNDLIAGGAFGYARTNATSTDIKGTSDTYAGAAYASWTPGAAVFDFRIAAGPSQMSTTRQIILAGTALSGSTNGIGVGTSFEAGYRFAIAPDVILKPYAGINWQGFRRDAYSESQLPIGLVYAAQTYDKLMTSVGAAIGAKLRTTDGTTLVPEVKLGWGYDLRDTTLVSQAALLDESFLVTAASPGRSAALVGAKLSGWRTETFRMFGAYNGEYRSNATSHQVSAGVRLNW